MAVNSKIGGNKSSATALIVSRKTKGAISFVPRMLTPSEREFLRRDLKNTIEEAKAVKV